MIPAALLPAAERYQRPSLTEIPCPSPSPCQSQSVTSLCLILAVGSIPFLEYILPNVFLSFQFCKAGCQLRIVLLHNYLSIQWFLVVCTSICFTSTSIYSIIDRDTNGREKFLNDQTYFSILLISIANCINFRKTTARNEIKNLLFTVPG